MTYQQFYIAAALTGTAAKVPPLDTPFAPFANQIVYQALLIATAACEANHVDPNTHLIIAIENTRP